MRRPQSGSTLKQLAYATKKLNGGEGQISKKGIAQSVGYSDAVANNVSAKIENTEGYHNAMIQLAHRSNNLVLAAMHEFEARGLEDFSNKDLISALNAIVNAWEKVDKRRAPAGASNDAVNPLRKIVINHVENKQTVINNNQAAAEPVTIEAIEAEVLPDGLVEDDLDF